jgi:hypothetical protein
METVKCKNCKFLKGYNYCAVDENDYSGVYDVNKKHNCSGFQHKNKETKLQKLEKRVAELENIQKLDKAFDEVLKEPSKDEFLEYLNKLINANQSGSKKNKIIYPVLIEIYKKYKEINK